MPHSYISSKCKIQESQIHHLGVFATQRIEEGELVAIWGGDIRTGDQNYATSQDQFENSLQVYETPEGGIYLTYGTTDGMEGPYLINHSCSPNVGIKGQIVYVARKDIEAGEELFWDYETAEVAEKGWRIVCKCGSPQCREIIEGEAWKDPEFQRKNEGFFSWYLQEKINTYKKKQEETSEVFMNTVKSCINT
jgi:SET domain-containing protein